MEHQPNVRTGGTPTYDVAIIGGGIIGCAVAYYLSRTKARILLLERENDVATGTTRANSAILHSGYDPKPGSLMAKSNVWGNKLAYELCEALDVEHNRCGSLVLALAPEEKKTLEELYQRGVANGVPGLELWTAEQVKAHEPAVTDTVQGGLYAPTAGVVNPWEWAIAMAEVAVREGVEVWLEAEVTAITLPEEHGSQPYRLETAKGPVEAQIVINCAGLYAGVIHRLVAESTFKLIPTKGEYFLLDRGLPLHVNHVLFPCPNEQGKGVLVAPTMHGNIIVGPNAHVEESREDTANTREGLSFVRERATRMVPALDLRQNIRNFAGLRANCDRHEFVLEFARERFLDIAGIQSPGLTAAPALALMAIDLLAEAGYKWEEKKGWDGTRRVIRFNHLTPEQKAEVIAKDPLYGRVICRCETITEGEIAAALRRPLPPRSLDAVKRRCGTGLGRCQGGFCGPRIVEILARTHGVPPEEILQDREGSYLLVCETKQEHMPLDRAEAISTGPCACATGGCDHEPAAPVAQAAPAVQAATEGGAEA